MAAILRYQLLVCVVLALGCQKGAHGDRQAKPGPEAPLVHSSRPPANIPTEAVLRPIGIFAVCAINEPEQYGAEAFAKLLDNPAVAGLALRERWENLEPEEGRYRFERIDAAHRAAAARNKKIQLILVPGFFSPSWLLARIPPVDGRSPDGGKVSFPVPYGPAREQKRQLPLPWNAAYKQAWKRLLQEVARRYNPSTTLVSIAVAGPTSVSAEMSLPADTAEDLDTWRRVLLQFFPNLDPSDPRQNANAPIIAEWKQAISLYGQLFERKTIVLTRGSGLLGFNRGDAHDARSQIVRYFADPSTSLGLNAKATQTSGMKASRESDGGIVGVKELSGDARLSPRILGGAQFNSSVSRNPETMGNPSARKRSTEQERRQSSSVSPTQALRNVLEIYFNDTPCAQRFGGRPGVVPMHYLQIYSADIEYATAHQADDPEFQKTLLEAARCLSAR